MSFGRVPKLRRFLPEGDVQKAGQLLKNTNLARSLEAIAQDGAKGFYDGDVGRELTRYAKENGGFFNLADLQAQGAEWSEPIRATYRDVTIYETAPPTQGITVLQMLKLLEPLELHKMQYLGADHVHLMVQAKHLAYYDRDRWLSDPKFANVPTKMLLSSEYISERRKLIDPRKAIPWNKVPSYGSLNGDTVYIAVVDRFGNAVSLTQSLYWGFGSAVVAGETGIVLQNRGAYFSLDPKHPNKLEPGKIHFTH
jgi:gamma-glutamyltranspeptidase/glutathione hydrolase